MTTSPQRVDGRTARSERTRNAIVDAQQQLIREGDLRPTAERIAKQAGVSLRALWSHFSDLEALFAASGERVLRQAAEGHKPVSAKLPLAERIDAYTKQRARMLEQLAPNSKASALKEPFSETLQHYRRAHLNRARDEIATLFAAEIGQDQELLDSLTAVTMSATWSTWREVMKMSVAASRSALSRTFTAMLSTA